jgi:heat-inducible transcriptional repressor
MENYRLTMEELDIINELAHCKVSELDKIINRAGKVMSDLTHCVTLSFTKDGNGSGRCFSRFDTVFVDNSSFLLVMIPEGRGKVRSEHIRTEYFLSEDSLTLIKNILNENLAFLSIEQVTMPVIMKMESAAGRLAPLISSIIRTVFSESASDADGNVKVEGLSNLLAYPEFSNVEKLRSIMDVFDKKKGYIKQLLTGPDIIDDTSENITGLVPMETSSGVKIYIGDEEGSSALSDTSLILCTVPVGNTESVIGILGPKRMDYKKAVSALRQFAESIEKAQTDGNDKSE